MIIIQQTTQPIASGGISSVKIFDSVGSLITSTAGNLQVQDNAVYTEVVNIETIIRNQYVYQRLQLNAYTNFTLKVTIANTLGTFDLIQNVFPTITGAYVSDAYIVMVNIRTGLPNSGVPQMEIFDTSTSDTLLTQSSTIGSTYDQMFIIPYSLWLLNPKLNCVAGGRVTCYLFAKANF